MVSVSTLSDEATVTIKTANRLQNVESFSEESIGLIRWDAATDDEYDNIFYQVSICSERVWIDPFCNAREFVTTTSETEYRVQHLDNSWSQRYAIQATG